MFRRIAGRGTPGPGAEEADAAFWDAEPTAFREFCADRDLLMRTEIAALRQMAGQEVAGE
jgi:hypothetical protein